MFGFLARRLIDTQERLTGSSADYARDLYAGSPGAFWRFTISMMSSRYVKTLPPEAYCAAGFGALRAEDCGPCVQIGVNLALAQGIATVVVRAAATGDVASLSEDNRLAYEFAYAVATRDLRAEELRPMVERKWGKAGLAELALEIASVRAYPAMKRALGYAQTCQRVVIEGEVADARPREAAA
ncbi:MAG: hypothetical protein Q8J92_02225 [Parvibaculum sp.]|nr:hypothetical protein [Parvibaculum sp.]